MNARQFVMGLQLAVTAGTIVYAIVRDPKPDVVREVARARVVSCPAAREVVEIRGSTDPNVQRRQKEDIKAALLREGTTVRLGPDVDLDFSDMPTDFLPLSFGRCVTLTSVSGFVDAVKSPAASETINKRNAGQVAALGSPTTVPLVITAEARTPRFPGPVLRYGKIRSESRVFIDIRCNPGEAANDGARISGFRLFGPDFGHQSTNEIGINVERCIDVEIFNMEIAGWGGSGIEIEDDVPGRIFGPQDVLIHDNFIHHNQHPQKDGHAQGYGVNVNHFAWAHIYRNVFDLNRHSIAAAGNSGGYMAEHNLVLKGGGYHGTFYNSYTHAFDVHGTGCKWSKNLCGDAAVQLWYIGNAFQYRKDHAIKIRGKPKLGAFISENVFPHPGLEADWGDDAVHLNTSDNVTFGPGNVIDFDSFGKLGVCDFDGDAVDDLFLATGRTWWFSSLGEFQWSYLNTKTELLIDVRLGYFDNDLRCDVVAQEADRWVFSSGGTGPWQLLGSFGPSLSRVEFGRFDPNETDTRPGATRRTTHAFYRSRTGQWSVTALTAKDWKPVASSSFPMNKLRFGDFTGDGVTDVLAVEGGRWAISRSANRGWRRLNRTLSDPVAGLFIANMDPDDNIDDILRLDRKHTGNTANRKTTLTWYRSKNGREPWRLWREYTFRYAISPDVVTPVFGFAGRFGLAPGGGTLVFDHGRFGHFFSQAEIAVGTEPNWRSVFPY